MSVIFPFVLPTTGTTSLASHISSETHNQLVVHADGARALVRDSLKRAKRAANPDILAVVKAIEEYLPYLFTILNGPFQINSSPMFSWRMPLKTSRALTTEAPRVEIASLEFEKGMILLTYALAFMCLAENAAISASADRKWKLATAHLAKAQSIVLYLTSHPVQLDDIPTDLHAATLGMLLNVTSGSLHLLILYKNLEQEAAGDPAGSATLLSRVAIYSADKYGAASQMLISVKRTKVGSDALEDWIADVRNYCIASLHRFMAIDVAKKNHVGNAIGHLNAANDALAKSKLKKALSKDNEELSRRVQAIRVSIATLMQTYKTENDSFAFQTVPKTKDLNSDWPSGREVVAATEPWTPPSSLLAGNSSTGVNVSNSLALTGTGGYF
jgi:hypothetical protein